MNPNPYQSPELAGHDPATAKPYTRIWLNLDFFWIGSAAGPAFYEIVIEWLFGFDVDPDTLPLPIQILVLIFLLSILLFFIVSFIVNIVGSIKGRRMSIAGVAANIVSLICIIIPGP